MTIEIIFQIGFLLFAVASAYEEEAFTYPFRELSGEQFPFQTKFQKLKTAHRAGAVGVLILLALAGAVELDHYNGPLWMKIVAGILLAVVCGCWYWLVFDPVFARRIGQGTFYLGGTAGLDGWAKKTFKKNAGLKKALFCVVVIILINFVYGLLLY